MASRQPDRQRTGLWQPALRADRGAGDRGPRKRKRRRGLYQRDGRNGRPSHCRYADAADCFCMRAPACRKKNCSTMVRYFTWNFPSFVAARANGRTEAAARSATDSSNRSPGRNRADHAILIVRNELLRCRSSGPDGSGGAQQRRVFTIRQFRSQLGIGQPIFQQRPQGVADHCRTSRVGDGLQVRRASRAVDTRAHPSSDIEKTSAERRDSGVADHSGRGLRLRGAGTPVHRKAIFVEFP